MAILGRPCAVQAREVDIQPFSLDTSPVDLQYLERMVSSASTTFECDAKQTASICLRNLGLLGPGVFASVQA